MSADIIGCVFNLGNSVYLNLRKLALLTASSALISCGLKSNNKSKTNEGVPQVEAEPLPEAVDLPPTDESEPEEDNIPLDPLWSPLEKRDTQVEPPGTPLINVRPDAPLQQNFPTLQSIDPRGLLPSGSYQAGGGKLDPLAYSGRIVVPSDGRAQSHPACTRAITAPGKRDNASITVDGELAEWLPQDVIGIDRAGDGADKKGGLDVRELYFASHGSKSFIGVRLEDRWDESNTSDVVFISFRELLISQTTAAVPDVAGTALLSFEVRGSKLYQNYQGQRTVVAQNGDAPGDFGLVIKANVLELNFPNGVPVAMLTTGRDIVLDVSSQSVGNFPEVDSFGPHVMGLQDDYACLVPMPDAQGRLDHFKLMVMRRENDVDPGVAEVIYRAMVAAAPAVEFVTGDHLDAGDTVSITVVKDMGAAGLYLTLGGMYFEDGILNLFGEKTQPLKAFFVAAHEYSHGLNTGDYALPNLWMNEGHSDWIAHKALRSYYGNSVELFEVNYDATSFKREEDAAGGTPMILGDVTWGQAPYSGLFYYRKSSSYFEMLSDRANYADWRDNHLGLYVRAGILMADTLDFLTRFLGLATYVGSGSDNLGAGWVSSGSYAQSVFPRTRLDDSDGDGLMDFWEDRIGTDKLMVDSDGDGYTDAMETLVQRDPKIAETVSALVPDHHLADWETLAPTTLRTDTTVMDNGVDCISLGNIKRYGVAFGSHWLLSAVEMESATNTDERLEIVVFVKNIQNEVRQLLVQGGKSWFAAYEPSGSRIRPGTMANAFRGASVEMAFNDSWLQWLPGEESTIQVRIGAYFNDILCEVTPYFSPTLLDP